MAKNDEELKKQNQLYIRLHDRMVLSKWISLKHEEDKYNEIYFKLSPE